MTTQTITASIHPAELDAARLLLARMGISPADLVSSTPERPPAPTFAEYIPIVSRSVNAIDVYCSSSTCRCNTDLLERA